MLGTIEIRLTDSQPATKNSSAAERVGRRECSMPGNKPETGEGEGKQTPRIMLLGHRGVGGAAYY